LKVIVEIAPAPRPKRSSPAVTRSSSSKQLFRLFPQAERRLVILGDKSRSPSALSDSGIQKPVDLPGSSDAGISPSAALSLRQARSMKESPAGEERSNDDAKSPRQRRSWPESASS